jgi:5-methylcytosine-specific restriction endonuclease McrA
MSTTWTHIQSKELYVSSRWKTFRKDYITRHRPDSCEACSKPVSGADLTLDHNPPLTKTGGSNAFDEASMVVLCRSCNSRKNNRLLLRTNYSNTKLVSL